MDKFDYRSARIIGIAAFLCILFAALVFNAYKYLPETDTSSTNRSEVLHFEENIAQENIDTDEDEQYQDDDIEEENNGDEDNRSFENNNPIEPLEDLDDVPMPKELNASEQSVQKNSPYEDSILQATKAKEEKNYTEAINNFSNALTLTDNLSNKAVCYESIATIHAIQKHYGSAISFAQKAYNLEPTTQRELLLARLYYKTGEINKANDRMNSILQRDFIADK